MSHGPFVRRRVSPGCVFFDGSPHPDTPPANINFIRETQTEHLAVPFVAESDTSGEPSARFAFTSALSCFTSHRLVQTVPFLNHGTADGGRLTLPLRRSLR